VLDEGKGDGPVIPDSNQKWQKAITSEAMVFCVFFMMTVVLTYPAVFCLPRCVPNSGDPLLNSWILAWDVRKLTTGAADFFNANIFYPYSNTLAYSESQLASALLAMPVLLVSHNVILAHNWVCMLSFAFSGFGMYLLVRHLTGSRLAGFVSGTIFAFCPYKIAHFGQLQMLSAQWMPFALIFFDKWLRRHKWGDFICFTLFFNLQALSSYYYALFFSLAVGILLLLYLLMGGKKLWSNKLTLQLACFSALTLLINLPLAVPYLELSQMGFVRSKETTQLFQATLTDYLTTTPWNRLYGSLTASLRGRYWSEHTSFPGILAFVLALLGVTYRIFPAAGRRPQSTCGVISCSKSSRINAALAYAYVLVVAVILAMGTSWELPGTDVRFSLPFDWLFDHVPGFQGLRVPSRFNVITMLALAVLSGYGVSELRKQLGGKSPTLKAAISLMLPMLVAIEYLAIPLPYTAVAPSQVPGVYSWLAGIEEDAVIIELPFSSTADGGPDWGAFPYVEGWRVYFSTFHWKSTVNGYSGFLPLGYQELIKDMLGFPDGPSISRLNEIGVNYIVLDREMFGPERRTQVEDNLRKYSAELTPVREFDDTLVLRVVPQGEQAVQDLIRETSFEGKMTLIGFGVDKRTLHPGESFALSLLWRAVDEMEQDYTVFTHLLDTKGYLLSQHDGPPQGGQMPTSTWHQGQVIRDQHQLTVLPDAPPGIYNVAAGVYLLSTMERLPLVDKDGQVLDDKIMLMQLEVTEN